VSLLDLCVLIRKNAGKYRILDGHLMIAALRIAQT
jgi:hypothetical protein